MKIDFDNVKLYLDIEKKSFSIRSIRKKMANLLYTQGFGIEVHALAFKIFNGDENTDYSDSEVNIIKESLKMCSPAVIDTVNDLLNQN